MQLAFYNPVFSNEKGFWIDLEKLNVNGDVITFGHSIGASSVHLLISLVYEMNKRNLYIGVTALCIEGGQSMAVIVGI